MADSESKSLAPQDDIDWRLKQMARQMEAMRLNYVDPSAERLSRIEADLKFGFQTIQTQLAQINEAISKLK